VLAIGAALRLYSYFADPSLTVDDAMLTLNVASRSLVGLLRPLAMEQTAPVGFLWALKLATVIGGVRDPVLRCLPLLAGIALPYAVWRLARRLLPDGPALLAAAFAALSPILIEYSISVKPYTVDALVTVPLLGITLDTIERPDRVRAWLRLGLAGVLAVICSTPAVFTLAGCGAALLASRDVRTEPRTPLRLTAVVAAWVGAFGAMYFAVARAAATSPYMQAFWGDKFLTPAALADLAHAWNILRRVPAEPFVSASPLPWMPLALWLIALIGLWQAVRRRAIAAVLLIGPLAALFAASALHRYPIAPRVCLFLSPCFFLLFASAYAAARERWPVGLGGAAAQTVAGLWLVTLAVLAANLRWWAPATRALVAELDARAAPQEPVYLFTGVVAAWTVYETDWPRADSAAVATVIASQTVSGGAFHNAPSRGRAVSDTEGSALIVRDHGRAEIIGLSPGIQWREGTGYVTREPDAGWAQREAERLRSVTDSTAWIAIAHDYPGEALALLRGMDEAGGREIARWTGRGVLLVRVRFRH